MAVLPAAAHSALTPAGQPQDSAPGVWEAQQALLASQHCITHMQLLLICCCQPGQAPKRLHTFAPSCCCCHANKTNHCCTLPGLLLLPTDGASAAAALA
jgi:hypothetical protein